MIFPGPDDWSFGEIRERDDRERAELLETGIEPSALVEQVSINVLAAINDGRARYGVDSKDGCPRIRIQIPVAPNLYDQFYNGRYGYRAHYWITPDDGNDFDKKLVCLLGQAISAQMPVTVEGRKIEVRRDNLELDVGSYQISREFALRSVAPESSKAWICERLITGKCGPLQWRMPYLGPRLIVEKWKACISGLLAPRDKWLEFKGGFVDDNGRVKPSKDRKGRANQIHRNGWTWAAGPLHCSD